MQQIYFAQCGQRIKIGITTDIRQRFAQLRVGAGGKISLLGAVKGDVTIERALHKKLKPYHLDGEWFRDCPETRAAIHNSLNNFQPVEVPPATEKPKRDKNPKFAIVARALWPEKTDAHLATIAGTDCRSARRWLAGQCEPPGVVIAAILVEITKR